MNDIVIYFVIDLFFFFLIWKILCKRELNEEGNFRNLTSKGSIYCSFTLKSAIPKSIMELRIRVKKLFIEGEKFIIIPVASSRKRIP